MIERIFDFISHSWEKITPIVVIDQTEMGIIKRLGIFRREIKLGLRFKIPFIETYETALTIVTTLGLHAQTLTTKDNKSVVISAIVKYNIKNVKLYLLKVYDSTDVIADVTMGEIQKQVRDTKYEDLSIVESQILKNVRKSVKAYGVHIHFITFIDIGAVRSIRLIQDVGEGE